MKELVGLEPDISSTAGALPPHAQVIFDALEVSLSTPV